jgi:nicotinamide mononucleotide transporter
LIWTALEVAAVVFTLINVWLAVKENIWTWPTGIVCVLLTLVVLWHQQFYLNAWLQLVYFGLSIHGWYEWLHGGENKTERRVSRTSARAWGVLIVIGVVLTMVLLALERRFAADAALPLWDSSTAAFSIVGQYMLNMKMIENWIIWILVDVAYVFMYTDQKLYYLAALNAFLLIFCVKGLIDWRRSMARFAA